MNASDKLGNLDPATATAPPPLSPESQNIAPPANVEVTPPGAGKVMKKAALESCLSVLDIEVRAWFSLHLGIIRLTWTFVTRPLRSRS